MMTIKAMPKTETVRELLSAQLDAYKKSLGEQESKLDQLNRALIKPIGHDDGVKTKIEYLNQDIEDINTKLAILDSHSGPRILTELQIG